MRYASIPGLINIVPPNTDAEERPGLLEKRHLEQMSEVRFLKNGKIYEEDEFGKFNAYLLQLQGMMQWLTGVGKNEKQIGIEDMNIAFVNGAEDGAPNAQDSGDYFVVQSKDTKHYQIFAINLRSTDQDRSSSFNINQARNTAQAIIDLSYEDRPWAEGTWPENMPPSV